MEEFRENDSLGVVKLVVLAPNGVKKLFGLPGDILTKIEKRLKISVDGDSRKTAKFSSGRTNG